MTGAATPPDLADIEAAYRRVTTAINRGLEDAAEFDAEPMFAALERDRIVVDAGFFVLIFGQIENRVNTLAERRAAGEARRAGVRGRSFPQRLALALPGREHGSLRHEVEGWYAVRSQAAHGERLDAGYNIAAALLRARELERLIAGA